MKIIEGNLALKGDEKIAIINWRPRKWRHCSDN